MVNAGEQTAELFKLVATASPRNTPLRAGHPVKGCLVNERWRVRVNEQVEVDIDP
jgi:hypothetical protein